MSKESKKIQSEMIKCRALSGFIWATLDMDMDVVGCCKKVGIGCRCGCVKTKNNKSLWLYKRFGYGYGCGRMCQKS